MIFCWEPGFYGTTITRPKLYDTYLRDQLADLMANYRAPVYVGLSRRPISAALCRQIGDEGLSVEMLQRHGAGFDLPDLHATDDDIANCVYKPESEARAPFIIHGRAEDYSSRGLHHYTGTSPGISRKFILITNYQR